ncbi:hypothetical protein KC357_g150 [Hortaea werneckii]|nr:hypothetical protein KC357_g150 [Hortaea werneckii]
MPRIAAALSRGQLENWVFGFDIGGMSSVIVSGADFTAHANHDSDRLSKIAVQSIRCLYGNLPSLLRCVCLS